MFQCIYNIVARAYVLVCRSLPYEMFETTSFSIEIGMCARLICLSIECRNVGNENIVGGIGKINENVYVKMPVLLVLFIKCM